MRNTDPAALRRQLDALADLCHQQALRLELAEVEAEKQRRLAGVFERANRRLRAECDKLLRKFDDTLDALKQANATSKSLADASEAWQRIADERAEMRAGRYVQERERSRN